MTRLRVALIGAGNMGSYLVNAIVAGEAGPIELIGICDVPAAKAQLESLARSVRQGLQVQFQQMLSKLVPGHTAKCHKFGQFPV